MWPGPWERLEKQQRCSGKPIFKISVNVKRFSSLFWVWFEFFFFFFFFFAIYSLK